MIFSRFSNLLGILFLMACFGALMNPPPYILIATVFLIMGLVLLPSTNKLTMQTFNYKINGRTKTIVVLIGFMLVCLVVPQVGLETNSFSIDYSDVREEDRNWN